jgi:hypothetical protein
VNGLNVIGTVVTDVFSPAVGGMRYHSECLLTLKPLFFTTGYLGFFAIFAAAPS